jgi:hypothetical protein
VTGILVIVKKSTMPQVFKITAVLLMAFTGAVELFFGYVENYTPVIVLGAAFVFTSYRALTAGRSIIIPGIILVVAAAFHVQAVLLAPSYVFLVVWRLFLKKNQTKIPLAGILITALTVVIAVAVGRTGTFGRFFLAPIGTGGEYGVFSPTHLLDALNMVTLLFPAWLLFVVLTLRRRVRHGDKSGSGHRARTAYSWCLISPSLLFLLLFNPELGMARDWDLYCFIALGLLTPAVIVLKRHWPRLESSKLAGLLLPPALAVSALVAVPWIGINASPSKSVDRYQSILEYDQTNPGYAYENLARHFEDNFDLGGQIETMEKAYATSRNPRYLAKLGKIYYDSNDLTNAAAYLRRALAAKPDFDDARKLLVAVLRKLRAVDELISVCGEGTKYSPQTTAFHFYLGEAYFHKGMIEEGLKAFDACSKLNPPRKLLQDMNRITEEALKAQRESNQP